MCVWGGYVVSTTTYSIVYNHKHNKNLAKETKNLQIYLTVLSSPVLNETQSNIGLLVSFGVNSAAETGERPVQITGARRFGRGPGA